MTELKAERAVAGPEPAPAALLELDERHPADPPSAAPGGVALARLVSLVRLTPPQALEIGASVLAAAAAHAEPDDGSAGGQQLRIDQLVIGADGQVVPGPAGRLDGRPAVDGPPLSALAAVLADVAGAARIRALRADPAAGPLLAALDRARTDLPVTGVPVAARTLREAATAIDRGAVRAELAALVRAVGGTAASASGSRPAGAAATVVRADTASSPPERGSRSATRRIGAWLLSVLVVAAVVVLEVVVLRDDIADDVGLLLDAGRSGSEPSTAPEPDGPPVAAPAPAAAGSVTAVDLRPLAPCEPGTPCTVRLLVRLAAATDPQVVTWSYRIVDRCTGAAETAPGGTVTVPPGGERAAAVGTVPLPALEAVAVFAVTDLPAVAASPPLSVGSCPSGPPAG